jgi:D-cysteine desulfhydrase
VARLLHTGAELAEPHARSEPRILALAPGLARRPFVPLAQVTPVEPLPSVGPNVWVKRDDQVADTYGGNKVRRFEWLLAEALDRGASRIVTVGGLASTQATATIAIAGVLGLGVTVVLFDQPDTPYLREALATDLALGAELVHAGGYARAALATARQLARARGRYFIAPGASGPLANLGYVDAMLELAAQVDAGAMPRPDRIVVATGSGGTAAGLAVGAAVLGWPTTIVAARITDPLVSNLATLRALARLTLRRLRREGFRGAVAPVRIAIEPRVLGPGYGEPTLAAVEGARRYGELFGAPGEVTYSGKSLAALALEAREHPGEAILLWNTLSTRGRRLEPPTTELVERAPASLRRYLEPRG